jgi:hypothetical protein
MVTLVLAGGAGKGQSSAHIRRGGAIDRHCGEAEHVLYILVDVSTLLLSTAFELYMNCGLSHAIYVPLCQSERRCFLSKVLGRPELNLSGCAIV